MFQDCHKRTITENLAWLECSIYHRKFCTRTPLLHTLYYPRPQNCEVLTNLSKREGKTYTRIVTPSYIHSSFCRHAAVCHRLVSLTDCSRPNQRCVVRCHGASMHKYVQMLKGVFYELANSQ